MRSLVRRRKLPARKNNAGQWLVQLSPEALTQPDLATDAGSDAVVGELRAEVTELREALAEARAEAKAAVDVAVAKVEAAERVAAAKVETAQADARALRELIAELKADLADLRRPFWVRWWR